MNRVRTVSVFLICAMLFLCSSCSSREIENPSSQIKSSSSNIEEIAQTAPADTGSLSGQKVCWGVGSIKAGERPYSAVSYNEKYGSLGGRFIGEDNKNIYLTFDEGYENGYTADILDTLKEKKVSAVFFVTYDYVQKKPELVKRMINEGHIVGNHSWSHPSVPTCSDEGAKNEIMRLHNYVLENFNYKMTLFRFPMGEFSERTLAIAKNCGYESVFWSFAYVDWKTDNQPERSAALEKTTNCVHNGAIYLLHAVSKTNAEILGDFIDAIQNKGYTFSKYNL